jgi:putative chitinase
MPTLKRGSSGESVKNWQHALNAYAKWAEPLLSGDGEFGELTDEKTREFQSGTGCVSDGIVGPASRTAMGETGFNQLGAARLFAALKGARPKYPMELVSDTSVGGWLHFAEITTRARLAAFYAQTAHESARFCAIEERWGPTKQQKRYEPVTSLSKQLGNTKAGDGYRFRGRGAIQTTGRGNYRRASLDLGMGRELEENPDRVGEPHLALLTSAAYWARNRLNRYATLEPADFKALTKKINGGYTGHADRVKLWTITRGLLGLV